MNTDHNRKISIEHCPTEFLCIELWHRLRKKSAFDILRAVRKRLLKSLTFSNKEEKTSFVSPPSPPDTITQQLLIIDDQVPQSLPHAFRNAEFTGLAERFEEVVIASFSPEILEQFPAATCVASPRTYEEFKEDCIDFLNHYPSLKDQIAYLYPDTIISSKCAYMAFLNNAYALVPFLEAKGIPFVFELYPGGGFALYDTISDHKLNTVCNSKMFRGLIATQPVSVDYLTSNNICNPERIFEVFGGFPSISKNNAKDRLYFGEQKKKLDISFVAMNYAFKGLGKGYDLVLNSARILCKQYDDIRFHIVGNWNSQDIADFPELKNNVIYYGKQPLSFFPDFFQTKDISLNPTRPFCGSTAFDGFPLGIDAAICGVPLFVTDELDMNRAYDSDEIEIIHPTVSNIVERIAYYHDRPNELKILAQKCSKRSLGFCSIEKQIEQRIRVLSRYVTLEG